MEHHPHHYSNPYIIIGSGPTGKFAPAWIRFFPGTSISVNFAIRVVMTDIWVGQHIHNYTPKDYKLINQVDRCYLINENHVGFGHIECGSDKSAKRPRRALPINMNSGLTAALWAIYKEGADVVYLAGVDCIGPVRTQNRNTGRRPVRGDDWHQWDCLNHVPADVFKITKSGPEPFVLPRKVYPKG